MNPTLVEPHDLEVSSLIVDQPVDDVHSPTGDPPYPDSYHSALEEYPRAGLDRSFQADDLGPVFIASREMEQQIEHRLDALCRQSLGAARADTFESRQWVVGAEGAVVRGQSGSISKRH